MIKILLVGLGGFAGSICRYLVNDTAQKLFSHQYIPYGTITVNILGCLIIGVMGGLSETRQIFSPEIRSMILIGFLGGFTTFSAFGYELFTAAKSGQIFPAGVNLMIHVIFGVGAVWFGFVISKQI